MNSGDQGRTARLAGGTTPEPSTLALLGIGTIGLVGYAWRRRLAKRAAASSENAAPAILSLFPSNSIRTREIRRAA